MSFTNNSNIHDYAPYHEQFSSILKQDICDDLTSFTMNKNPLKSSPHAIRVMGFAFRSIRWIRWTKSVMNVRTQLATASVVIARHATRKKAIALANTAALATN